MVMTLSGALASLTRIQAGLSVDFQYVRPDGSTQRIQRSVKRVFRMPPDENKALADGDLPCWINLWTFKDDSRGLGMSQRFYDLHLQLFISKSSETNLMADVATHFHDAWLQALWTNLKLIDQTNAVQAANGHKIRGGDPTIGVLRWNNVSYVGLDYHMDIDQIDGVTFG